MLYKILLYRFKNSGKIVHSTILQTRVAKLARSLNTRSIPFEDRPGCCWPIGRVRWNVDEACDTTGNTTVLTNVLTNRIGSVSIEHDARDRRNDILLSLLFLLLLARYIISNGTEFGIIRIIPILIFYFLFIHTYIFFRLRYIISNGTEFGII